MQRIKIDILDPDYIGKSLKPNNDTFIDGSWTSGQGKSFIEIRKKFCAKCTLKTGFSQSTILILRLILSTSISRDAQ